MSAGAIAITRFISCLDTERRPPLEEFVMHHRSLAARCVLGIAITVLLAAGTAPTLVTYGQPNARNKRATQRGSSMGQAAYSS